MRLSGVAGCLAIFLLVDPAGAADQAEKAEAGRSKAGVLEENAAAKSATARPALSENISKAEAQAVDPIGEEPLDGAITCLARTIYWEAKGEGDAGMQAVANVVMNRLRHTGFPKTICGVVTQGHEQGACQFSWWCDGKRDTAEEQAPYTLAKEIARQALNRQLADRTDGALYYHQGVPPSWAEQYLKTAQIGAHLFYKPAGGEAK
jgi:spore germination cell wall hydrolase CwlJ-like protein